LISRLKHESAALLVLLLIPLAWFGPVVLGGKTLLPADNLYSFEPWSTFAAEQGVGIPHNELLNDLILENYAWKLLIREGIESRQLPLWNPYIFSGVPFLAAGQHSALYPLSLLFYILPLSKAYGIFTWLSIALAGLNMYIFGRVLRLRRSAALLAGLVFMFSGFFLVSVVFQMIIAAAAWLPLFLACIEIIVRRQEEKGDVDYSPVPYIVVGTLVLGIQTLAGHAEITYYTLLVAAFYALWRLLQLRKVIGSIKRPLRLAAWMLVMVLLGLALGGVQFIPMIELLTSSHREGSVTYADVVGWAWPARQILTFFIPNFLGNPSHHSYYDIWTRSLQQPFSTSGESVRSVFWGVKNYVEGGNYLGILAWPLALLGVVLPAIKRRNGESGSGQRASLLLAVLALLSLLFAFGTPLYAILYYGLPGYRQLHSAFRWVFPFTLSFAVLAGIGLNALLARLDERSHTESGPRPLISLLAWCSLLSGIGMLVALALSLVLPRPFVAFGQLVLDRSDLARAVFANGGAFWSYQAPGLLQFGLVAAVAGILLLWAARFHPPFSQFEVSAVRRNRARVRIWSTLAVGLVIADLWLFGFGFNPSTDPDLLSFTPPAVDFLRQDEGLWRFTTLIGPDEKTFNANVGMYYGFQDIRGYDSIIPRQYVEYMERIEPQAELLFNRIAPLSDVDSLESPLLDLLGVKYVLSTLQIPNSGYTLVYQGELNVYRNENALPRAFALVCEETTEGVDWPANFDPRSMLLLDATEGDQLISATAPSGSRIEHRLLSSCTMSPADVVSYGLAEVLIEASSASPAWLVLTDSHSSGWKAYTTRRDVPGAMEERVPIRRADGNFRAIELPAGDHSVRFHYMPRSFQLGLYSTFVSAMALLLLSGWWAWGRFYREPEGEGRTAQRVAKNTLVPMGMSLLNKGVDFVFAMLRLRVLSPAGEGSYTFAIGFYTLFEILIRFGLGTLLTREVAKARGQANRFFGNVMAIRLRLWLASLPIIALLCFVYYRWGDLFGQQSLTNEEALTIALFGLALLFASLSDAVTATFNAYEKMEFPAGIASAIALSKVALGALVLLPPLEWGFVGLGAVALLMNGIQALWLYLLLRQKLFTPELASDQPLRREMLGLSFPLMLNHLLATIFWRIDIWILRPLSGAASVGIYSAGLKWLDGLNVIPAYFTMAIFPVMSRLAHGSQESLIKAYRLALRLLIMIALPVMVFVLFTAEPLIQILGGAQYLPDSAIALRLLILSIPIGFANSVTQYVLIAIDQQRFLTKAFAIGVAFNLVANLIFIPKYGYRAAALILIPSELALLIPFSLRVKRHVAPIPWLDILWRPVISALIMAVVAYLLSGVSEFLAAIAGFVAGGGVLVLLGGFRHPDFDLFREALRRDRLLARWHSIRDRSSA